jgi:hypothetical protein
VARSRLPLVLLVLSTATLSSVLTGWLFGGSPEASPAPVTRGEMGQDGQLDALRDRLSRHESADATRESLLADRIAALEGLLETLRSEGPRDEATAAPEPDLTGLSDVDLAIRARLAAGDGNARAAIRLWREVLDRSPGREARLEALDGLARAYRRVKDYLSEEAVRREEMGLHRTGSREWLVAQLRVGMALRGQERHAQALSLIEPYAFAEDISAEDRSWARLWAADCMMRVGEPHRARPVLVQIVDEFGAREEMGWKVLVRHARERIAKIDE